jgi:hypothetical protein
MKKSVLIAVVLAVTVGLLGSAAMAANGLDVWQIGKPDGAVDPIQGAAEYPATRAYTEEFDYYVGTDSDPINSPSMPGYIGPANVCDFAGGRPCTDTTANLNIHFGLACNYDDGELTLVYDRYGSEADDLYLDGDWFANVSATEGGFHPFSFDLGAVPSGNHTITIEYAGGGSGNGHYIDYLQLQPAFTCVAIDIKPGSYPNSINLCSHGVVPIAILSGDGFDATTVDPSTVEFAGGSIRVKGKGALQYSLEDVDEDGDLDFVAQISVENLDLDGGSTTATVSGLAGDVPFEGTDSVNIVRDCE